MRRLLLAAALSCTAIPATAQARYDTMSMSCQAVQAAVQRDGTALLRYRSASGVVLYDRYVRDAGQCRPKSFPQAFRVPAADTKSCRVLKCVRQTDD